MEVQPTIKAWSVDSHKPSLEIYNLNNNLKSQHDNGK